MHQRCKGRIQTAQQECKAICSEREIHKMANFNTSMQQALNLELLLRGMYSKKFSNFKITRDPGKKNYTSFSDRKKVSLIKCNLLSKCKDILVGFKSKMVNNLCPLFLVGIHDVSHVPARCHIHVS